MRSRFRRTPLRSLLTVAGLAAGSLVALTGTAAPALAWPGTGVSITGHGYGHGRGMGQWGAYGYATNYGWSWTQILGHYYGGTTVKSIGLVPVTVDLSELDGNGSVWVTAGVPFTAGGMAVAANGSAQITLANGALTVRANAAGCGQPLGGVHPASSGLFRSSVSAPQTLGQMLTVCDTGRTYRGTLTLVNGNGSSRVVNTVGMDDYLRGVVPRESPASWGDAAGGKGMNALQAQAVAARSYAAVSRRYSWAHICDSQSCQVYGGAGLNGSVIEDPRTNTAVTSTSSKLLVNSQGAVVSAEFSASTGGWTAGGTFPAVQDLGDTASPYHDWSVSIPVGTVQDAFGVGTLQSITVTRNGLGSDGGRVITATVTGSSGRTTISGSDFAYELGLKSDWFTVHDPVVPTLFYTNSLAFRAPTDFTQKFGLPGDLPLACDWNGDGTDTVGVYRAPNFYITDSQADNAPYYRATLGKAGDLPVCGDWNGDGVDTIGVYDPRTAAFSLLNTNHPTSTTRAIGFLLGGHGYLPVAGDWTGSGRDSVGAFDPATARFFLINTPVPGAPRSIYTLGHPGNIPVAGDWNGDHKDTIGVFQGNRFAWTDLLSTHYVTGQIHWTYFGLPGDKPIAGDWNHDGRDTPGIGRHF